MLLTIKPPTQHDFKSSHDYPPLNSTRSGYSPLSIVSASTRSSDSLDSRMSQPHRGLPPPGQMAHPPPTGGLPAMALMGQLPAPPTSWTGQEESMRKWLHAKAEEEKRFQEEEKTKQENARLNQRRVEQSMLHESLQGGIPPVMVPLIFAGMGGGNLPNQSLEWAQHYMADMSLQQRQQQQQQQKSQQLQPPPQPQPQPPSQQQQQSPLPPPPPQQQQQSQQQLPLHQHPQHQQQQPPQPQPQLQPILHEDAHRDNKMVPPSGYTSHQQIQPALGASPAQSQQAATHTTPIALARAANNHRTSALSGSLSNLNTTDIQIQGPPPIQGPSPFTAQSSHPLQQTQNTHGETSQQTQSSPSIFFHHWVPPSTSSGPNPLTPSGKSRHGSPYSQNAPSHLRSDHQQSPKKRKAVGGHHAAPPPHAQTDTSPQYAQSATRAQDSPTGHLREGHYQSRRASEGPTPRLSSGQSGARPNGRQHRLEPNGDAVDVPHQRAGGSSTSTSGDEHQVRIGGPGAEHHQFRFPAGPEIRDRPSKGEDR